MSYTKGPWIWTDTAAGVKVRNQSQNVLAAVYKPPSMDLTEQRQNAFLIAAAPELLEALERISSLHSPDTILVEIQQARAAIEKAKGALK